MKLNVQIDDSLYQVEVPDDMLSEAKAVFQKIDRDLDAGWQMSREWISSLDAAQRCQVAADRLLTAIENNNQASITMMAGYILNKLPTIRSIHIDTTGDMTQTQIIL
ncbi:MAG: hypothetical protein HY080_15830 [Gammaproteobacteria bacterium]|nr:hypothetical protein [Gammaproteobacteria bacterium]